MRSKRRSVPPPKKTINPASPSGVAKPLYSRLWPVLTLLGAAVYGLLSEGPTLLTNAEKLPGEYERVSNSFLEWFYSDKDWKGIWSAGAEGYVDGASMNLSESDLVLHITPQRGKIGGEISLRIICLATPLLDYYLLDGQVLGDTATITAYDFVGGHRQNFFRFSAKRDGVVMTISPVAGANDWLPAVTRIALHPTSEYEDPYKLLHGKCAVEREVFMKTIRPQGLGR
jgi:hypothetical protein